MLLHADALDIVDMYWFHENENSHSCFSSNDNVSISQKFKYVNLLPQTENEFAYRHNE